MPLNNVTFETVSGGLGRLPEGEDHISAIILDTTSIGSWDNSLGHRYLSLDQAENDGIIEGDATYGLLHYFLEEFFRMAGSSEVYVINSSDAGYGADGIVELTKGKLRQAYIYSDTNYAGLVAKAATVVTLSDALIEKESPCLFILSVKDESTAISTSLVDLKTIDKDIISVVNFGDGSGKGAALATALGVKYIPAGGTVLGMLSSAQVHESIAYKRKYPLADLTEFTEAVLSDGSSVRSTPIATLSDMNDKGYIFATVSQGLAGTYVHDTHTTAADTSDTRYMENVRTIQKARRVLYAALNIELNGPLTVDADGKLSPDTVQYFVNIASRQMDLMQNDGELSGFLVAIDPDQDVLSTSKLEITVKLQPRGVARQIAVNIGFAVSLN